MSEGGYQQEHAAKDRDTGHSSHLDLLHKRVTGNAEGALESEAES